MNDKQINVNSESNSQIISCIERGPGNILNGSYSHYHSPFTYVVQSGDVDILRLPIDRNKKVDKDASLNLKAGLDMAAFYGNLAILKLLIQKGGSIDHHMIMH